MQLKINLLQATHLTAVSHSLYMILTLKIRKSTQRLSTESIHISVWMIRSFWWIRSLQERYDTFFKIKYKQRLSITDRQYLVNFTAYRMSLNKSINEIWTHLIKLDRKIITIQLNLSSLNMLKQWFQTLLHELLKKYCMTHNDIDSQHITVDEDIALLQEKEVQLKTEMSLWVRSQRDDEQE